MLFRTRSVVSFLALLVAAAFVSCFSGPGAPAGGHFVGDTGVIEGELPYDWYHLGLNTGTLRSPHGDSKVFLEEVAASLYRQREGSPEMAIYFTIKPNTSIGTPSSADKETRAGWVHSRLEKGIDALGGEYQRLVPSPGDKASLKLVGKTPVVVDGDSRSVAQLVGAKHWFQERLGKFELVMRTEAIVAVPQGFLCWENTDSYRLTTYQFRDSRRFYEAYIVIPERGYVERFDEAKAFIASLEFHDPRF